MSQRMQIYTPGAPRAPKNDSETLARLAVRVQARDAAEGIDRTWDEAYKRADENLAYVKAWADMGWRPSS